MSDAAGMADLLARVRAGRQQWLDVDAGDGKPRALQWALPGWDAQYRMGDGGHAYVRECVGLVAGWRGFTVGDLVPDDADAAKPLPFSPEVLALVLADHPGWVTQLAAAVHQTIAQRTQRQDDARGN